jgi:hypothetical protein
MAARRANKETRSFVGQDDFRLFGVSFFLPYDLLCAINSGFRSSQSCPFLKQSTAF